MPAISQPTDDPNSSNVNINKKIVNVITKFSFATKTGIAPHNPAKVNQDAYITSPHMMGLKHCHFFSICDGHGQYGRDVSSLLKHRLPFILENQMKLELSSHDLNQYPLKHSIYKSMKDSFSMSNKEVCTLLQDVRFR